MPSAEGGLHTQESIGDWDLNAGGRMHVMTIAGPSTPGGVWVMEVGAATARKLTGVFDHLARDFKLPRQERIEWKGADGVTVEGILFYRVDYQPGRRYPPGIGNNAAVFCEVGHG